jgi:peptidoglycan LD-endopeptidase CwlK
MGRDTQKIKIFRMFWKIRKFLFGKRLNGKSRISAHHYAAAPGLLLLLLVGVFLSLDISAQHRLKDATVSVSTPTPSPIPMPTEIDFNFLSQVEKCLIPVADAYGYDLRISSAFRSADEQDQLYQQGRTVDGHIVTDVEPGRSAHNYGLAVDVVDRWKNYDINWDQIGKMAAYCNLEQGDEGDQPHITHRKGLTMDDLRTGKRPPLLLLPCAIMDERAASQKPLTLTDLKNCGAPKF